MRFAGACGGSGGGGAGGFQQVLSDAHRKPEGHDPSDAHAVNESVRAAPPQEAAIARSEQARARTRRMLRSLFRERQSVPSANVRFTQVTEANGRIRPR